jgi:hypothetical protein
MVTHDHEADAMPQTFGDYLASHGRVLGVPVLVHTEKRGPAFDAANATARLMKAITRGVFLDVMPAWTDLTAALHVTPAPASTAVFWDTLTEAVYDALLGANGDTRDALWAKADAAVRGYALVAADIWAKDAERTQGGDDWADVDMDRRNEIVAAYAAAAKLRAFAKGVR